MEESRGFQGGAVYGREGELWVGGVSGVERVG